MCGGRTRSRQAARPPERKVAEPTLHMAVELGATKWTLAFSTGVDRSPRARTIQGRDLDALEAERKQRVPTQADAGPDASLVPWRLLADLAASYGFAS